MNPGSSNQHSTGKLIPLKMTFNELFVRDHPFFIPLDHPSCYPEFLRSMEAPADNRRTRLNNTHTLSHCLSGGMKTTRRLTARHCKLCQVARYRSYDKTKEEEDTLPSPHLRVL